MLILRWKDYSGGDFPAASEEKKCGFIKENESQLQINQLYSIVSWYLFLRIIFFMKSSSGFAMMAAELCGSFHRFGSSDFPSVTPCTGFRGKNGQKAVNCHRSFCKAGNPQFPIFFFFF